MKFVKYWIRIKRNVFCFCWLLLSRIFYIWFLHKWMRKTGAADIHLALWCFGGVFSAYYKSIRRAHRKAKTVRTPFIWQEVWISYNYFFKDREKIDSILIIILHCFQTCLSCSYLNYFRSCNWSFLNLFLSLCSCQGALAQSLRIRRLNRRDSPLGRSLVSADLTSDGISATGCPQRFAPEDDTEFRAIKD